MSEDYSIFQNQDEVVDNIEASAKAIGVNPGNIEKIRDGKPVEVMVAKKNCRWCFGQGTVNFAPSPSRKVRTRKNPELSSAGSVEEYLDGRNTRKPEVRGIDGKIKTKTVKALCKCVRIRLE